MHNTKANLLYFLLLVDFLLVIGFTAEVLRANINWKSFLKGLSQFGPKLQIEGDIPHYMNRPFIWYKNVGRGLFHFVTIHAFDRQTDRWKDGQTLMSRLRGIQCSVVKKTNIC